MEGKGIRLTAGIEHFNRTAKKGEELNQTKLAPMVLPDVSLNTARSYLSSWNNGKKTGKLSPDIIRELCKILKVDSNFLHDIKQMKK